MNERLVRQYKDGLLTWEKAPLADECRVDILIEGRRRASVMASPFQLDCLAVGFLFGENIINGPGDIKNLAVRDLEVFVELSETNPQTRLVSFANIDSEGVSRLDFAYPELDAGKILRLSEDFNSHSSLFRRTGAVHSCRLLDGPKQHHADDVARHNALDKVIGRYILDGPSGEPGLILTTGRVSTELLLKSAQAGIGAVISRSAPTDRAVELARKLNMILIGFSRQNRFNIYHGAEMIAGARPWV